MILTVLIIDTSYLLELYKVPSCFNPAHHQKVKARFARAVGDRNRLYVPYPVVFEVANHIVHGRDDGACVRLANRFVKDILQSFERTTPFIITPAIDERSLQELLRLFSGEFALERVGLTDGSIIEEARRLKKKYGDQAMVHIWTKDRRLKAREPDQEANAFVT